MERHAAAPVGGLRQITICRINLRLMLRAYAARMKLETAMNKIVILLLVAATGFGAAWLMSSRKLNSIRAEQAQREAAWLAEKSRLESSLSRLEADLETARSHQTPGVSASPGGSAPHLVSSARPAAPTPSVAAQDLMSRLTALSVEASTNKSRNYRQIIAQLENLAALGPAAVPAIREFLQQNQDAVFQTEGPPPGKGPKWKQDTAPPPSLRSGLIDTLKRIGGPEAEQLLAETLSSTGRGYEVLSIARALEEIAPGKYRDSVLATAQSLLANTPTGEQPTRLDQHSREYLYDALRQFGDATTLAQVAGQVVTANGTVDEAAISLLERGAAQDTLPIIYQALQDPRITDPKQREPLLELAMNHVGADAQAGELFMNVMQSPDVSTQLQQKALRHLAGEGLENEDAPTPRDVQVLQSRLQYLDAIKPSLGDPKLAAEWEKARSRIAGRLAPPQPKSP
jgi:hypothetical protein